MSGIEKTRGGSHSDLCRLARLTADWLKLKGLMPSDAVVLVPYAQLMGQARQAWVQEMGSAAGCLLPRFLSTQQWASDMQALFPQPAVAQAWSSQASIAHANARRMLAQTGLDQAFAGQANATLTDLLMQAAQALVPRVQAMHPEQREQWLDSMREQRVWGFQAKAYDADAVERSQLDAAEPALLRIALEWVGMTRFETDVLWEDSVRKITPVIVVWQGLQTEGLAQSLATHWGDAALVLPWPKPQELQAIAPRVATGEIRLFSANDAEQEARWAAACVIRHLHSGAKQIGVVALDRALVRRMRAMLAARGVTVHDETGWKLSTTHAATQLMAWLAAARYQVSTHEVLDAAKTASTVSSSALAALEKWLVKTRRFLWPASAAFAQTEVGESEGNITQTALQIEAWRGRLQKRQSLADWLLALREMCEQTGLLQSFEQDDAGKAVLAALHMDEPQRLIKTHPELASERWNLAELTVWAKATLEAASFVAERAPLAEGEPVVSVIPLSQVLGRRWDALVIAGCDELHLPWCPPDLHPWSSVQREKLGLTSEESRSQMQWGAWQYALSGVKLDVLRREHDQGEELAASPLLRKTLHGLRELGTLLEQQSASVMDMELMAAPEVQEPVATWSADQLTAGRLLTHLTPSAYEDLRRCPYRFHARKLLGLREDDELSEEADKRDWGNWVHQVLYRFHTHRNETQALADQLDQAAELVQTEMRLDGAAFLPFRMAWPDLRDAYLIWLQKWEEQGGRFSQAEVDASAAIEEADLTLLGRLDRVDLVGQGQRMIFDYKTESSDKSKKRVAEPLEDSQLAFYALLMERQSDLKNLRAAYLNLPESGQSKQGKRELPEVKQHELPDLALNTQTLRQGLVGDVLRVRQGHRLHALGDGAVCEYCEVRGLCRRDFWRGA